MDLSTLIPPSPLLKSGNGIPFQSKGKGRADEAESESESKSKSKGEDGSTVRDTKFYAFYDEIIPKGGRGRRGGYGL